jgi:hypothetical protein
MYRNGTFTVRRRSGNRVIGLAALDMQGKYSMSKDEPA